MKEQTRKENKPRLEYISEITKRLVDKRDTAVAKVYGWLANLKQRQIQKQIKRDKVNWIDALIKQK